jgi:hypothetical protein
VISITLDPFKQLPFPRLLSAALWTIRQLASSLSWAMKMVKYSCVSPSHPIATSRSRCMTVTPVESRRWSLTKTRSI